MRDQLLRDHKCFGHADSRIASYCNGFSNVEQQVLRWDGAQGGPDSKPSTFLDVLQRLPSGTNTILLMGDSTMGQVYEESICSLLRHLPEDLLDNLTHYLGVDGPSTEVNEIGAAVRPEFEADFAATRIPIIGRDMLVLFKRHEGVGEGGARGAVEPIRSMFKTIWRLRGDVLTVATQGFHVFDSFEERLPLVLDLLQFAGQRAKSMTLFLEPQATHFPHMGGIYKDMDLEMRNFLIGPNGCRFDVSTDTAFVNYYGSILNKVLATRQFPNVTLLPYWQATSTRGAAHKGLTESSLDCLHNCPNALLYEPIWEGMLSAVARS